MVYFPVLQLQSILNPHLSPVHTSNNVEATFDIIKATFATVERIVRLVTFDNVASTLLLVWTGIYWQQANFLCCYEHLKLRFYSSFNALYRRSKSSHSELVSVQLLQSFCLPVLFYGLDVTEPQKSVLTMLNNLINRAVYKIFKVFDIVISNIRQYLGLHDVAVIYKERHERFLTRTSLLRHAVLCSLTA